MTRNLWMTLEKNQIKITDIWQNICYLYLYLLSLNHLLSYFGISRQSIEGALRIVCAGFSNETSDSNLSEFGMELTPGKKNMFKRQQRVFTNVVFEQIWHITSICFDNHFMISLSNVFVKADETLATTVVHNFHQRKPKGFLKSISCDTSCFWRVF